MAIDSIDTIKRRMIKNASKMWGFSDVPDINSFDPVLGLIIGALAEEVRNVSREISQSDARIIEKMLDVLFSHNVFTHFPAHAIAYAKSYQSRTTIDEFYRFYFTKEIVKRDDRGELSERKNIWFTPTGPFAIFNADIKYFIAGNNLYEVKGMYKERIAGKPVFDDRERAKLVFGIRFDPQIDSLDGFSFYFSFKNILTDDRLFNAIHSAKWKINGTEVVFNDGFARSLTLQEKSVKRLVDNKQDISFDTIQFINELYAKSFLTLSDEGYRMQNFHAGEIIPGAVSGFSQEKYPGLYNKDILWFEAELFQPLGAEEINELLFSINCFPVFNRELHESTHTIIKGANVIPMLTDDYFFDIAGVTDSSNKVYLPQGAAGSAEKGQKYYQLRQNGIARFDSRDARETIEHLLDLVRDESAAFSIKGGDLISHELKQLDQILSRLKQRVNLSGVTNDPSTYLIIESDTVYDKINVEFWSLSGEQANNIRTGTRLTVYKGGDLNDKSLVLITQSIGGRQKLSKEEKLNKLRHSLLSKGRIVTTEDIKALCFELYGELLSRVEIKKGVHLEHAQGKGFSRTIDIYLYLKNKAGFSEEELKYIAETLKIRLKNESANLLPYRVFTE